MRPLPNIPDRDERPDPTATRAVWSLIFIGLGTLILSSLPERNGGWFMIVAVVSYVAAAWYLFLLLVRKDQ